MPSSHCRRSVTDTWWNYQVSSRWAAVWTEWVTVDNSRSVCRNLNSLQQLFTDTATSLDPVNWQSFYSTHRHTHRRTDENAPVVNHEFLYGKQSFISDVWVFVWQMRHHQLFTTELFHHAASQPQTSHPAAAVYQSTQSVGGTGREWQNGGDWRYHPHHQLLASPMTTNTTLNPTILLLCFLSQKYFYYNYYKNQFMYAKATTSERWNVFEILILLWDVINTICMLLSQ